MLEHRSAKQDRAADDRRPVRLYGPLHGTRRRQTAPSDNRAQKCLALCIQHRDVRQFEAIAVYVQEQEMVV